MTASPALTLPEYVAAFGLLARAPDAEFEKAVLEKGTSTQIEAMFTAGSPSPDIVIQGVRSGNALVRAAAGKQLARLAVLQAERVSSEVLLEALRGFGQGGSTEATSKATTLGSLARAPRNSPEAWSALLSMAGSRNPGEGEAACKTLASFGDRREAVDTLVRFLGDEDSGVAAAAMAAFSAAAGRPRWTGPPVSSLFPSGSPHGGVRAMVALAALKEGLPGAEEALRRELASGNSDLRLEILRAMGENEAAGRIAAETVLEDPRAHVRLEALLRVKGALLEGACRRYLEDPSVWVRGAALASLAQAGDDAALELLRGLVRTWKERPGIDSGFLQLYDPEAQNLDTMVLSGARTVAASGLGVDTLVGKDAAVTWLVRHLAIRSRCQADTRTLLESTDIAARMAASVDMATQDAEEAFQALTLAAGDANRSEPRLQEEATRAAEKCIGLRPARGIQEFHGNHKYGYVSEIEIRSAAGR